jgi:hypothetical protein
MKRLWNALSGLFGKRKPVSVIGSGTATERYSIFDPDNHLLPFFDREKFESLHDWEFGWAILESIQNASSGEDEKELSRRLSPGQKALYFIWYLDAQVTNGGFIQFYWNGYAKYLPPIIDGLRLIGEDKILDLVDKADKEFKANIQKFIQQKKKDDWEPLYEDLRKFDEYDDVYYETHDGMMAKIEKLIRNNPDEFIRLR